jgi:hypothetical protein
MCRVSIHLDETNQLKPVPVLVVNGQECRLSENELTRLIADGMWAEHHILEVKGSYYKSLADKYEEVQSGN